MESLTAQLEAALEFLAAAVDGGDPASPAPSAAPPSPAPGALAGVADPLEAAGVVGSPTSGAGVVGSPTAGAWSELAGVAEAVGLGAPRERSRSPLMRSRVLPFKAPPALQADAPPALQASVPMATTPKRMAAMPVPKVQAPMAAMPVPKALPKALVAPHQPAAPPSQAVIAKAMSATQEAADYAAALARMEAALAPQAQPPPAPGTYWRERPGRAEGRWGARGGKSNPNVQWHTGLARAKRDGPAAVAAFLAANKKPPRTH